MLPNYLQTRVVPIDELRAYPNQTRHHSRSQRAKLKRLIDRFGQIVPVIIDPSRAIIDGHLLWETMKEAGLKTIAVITVEGRTDPELRALRLALNRLPQDSRWNNDALKVEVTELLALSFEMELTGFDTAEIDAIMELDIPHANIEEDESGIPPVANVAVSKPGDLWKLGNHRVLCGDALQSADLDTLMGSATAQMVLSDPPYNVKIDGFVSGLGAVKHREFAQAVGEMTPAQFTNFLATAISNVASHLPDGGLLYLFIDWRHLTELIEAGRSNGLELLNLCVWAKTNGGLGSLYRSQHELIPIFKKGTAPHANNVELGKHGRSRSNVWTYRGMNSFSAERDDLLKIHPTVKPVALIADAMRDVTMRGDRVLDSFLGSGSTLIAAEETGRICHGVELDPLYVDVAIKRWQNLTGRDAVHAQSGVPFDEMSEGSSSDMGVSARV